MLQATGTFAISKYIRSRVNQCKIGRFCRGLHYFLPTGVLFNYDPKQQQQLLSFEFHKFAVSLGESERNKENHQHHTILKLKVRTTPTEGLTYLSH